MVRESHKKFMDKYPYFLDKNKGSNFFRTSDVNNRSIQRLYNELYRIYESFHISKRLTIWREQYENYNYKINFVANYPLIKEVSIYKNDDLIYSEEFTEEEEKNDFIYTYECKYTKNNIVPLTVYKCDKCGELYLTREPIEICDKCSTKNFTEQKAYKCSECDEIYFTTTEELHDCTLNNHTNTLEEIEVYKCLQCETIIFSKEQPQICTNCYIEEYEDTVTYSIKPTLQNTPTEEKHLIILDIHENETIEHIFLNESNEWNARIKLPPSENYILIDTENNHVTDFTLTQEEDTPTPSELILTPPEYVNDKRITCTDNRNVHINKPFSDSLEKKYIFQIATQDNPVVVNIINPFNNEIVETITLSHGNQWKAMSTVLPSYDELNQLINYEFEYDDNYDIYIHEENVYTSTEIEELENEETFTTEIPIIPDDLFRMEVTTYEEYYLVKGYPENDESYYDTKNDIAQSIYDHDHSLDELGRLNNIPRKQYHIISDPLLYPYTEPPYNNRASEDDYHYMKRMLEYNDRMWYMNPVSLELWKIYGLESELINRERYLLKVFDEEMHPFDEETGLVKCWTPLAWEHKDRFCDYDKTMKPYFFVTASNVRPLLNEPVTLYFNLMNSNGVKLDMDYYVVILKLTKDSTSEQGYDWQQIHKENIIADNYKINPTILNHNPSISNGNLTHFHCYAYNQSTDELIGDVYISVLVRDWSNADWYVDENANYENNQLIEDYVGDGTLDHPFVTLKEAVENISINNDLICILSDVTLSEPLIINENTKIVGKKENDTLPIITQTGNRVFINPFTEKKYETNKTDSRFFNIIGGKSCKLTLSNLTLANDEVESEINIKRWENNNKNINIMEAVVIRGGGVDITITFAYDNYDNGRYYPYDFIKMDLKMTEMNSPEEVLKNQKIIIKYKNKYLATVITDNNGEATYTFNINEKSLDDYSFSFKNSSTVFFQSEKTRTIHVTNSPEYIYTYDGEVDLTGEDYTDGDEINIFSNTSGLVDSVIVENDTISKSLSLSDGKYIFYTTHDNNNNGKVRNEWIVETTIDISDSVLFDETIIKNLTVNTDNDEYIFEYDTLTVDANTTLEDLDGALLDLDYDNEDEILIDSYTVDTSRYSANNILYTEAEVLKNAITSLTFNSETGELSFDRLGDIF